MQSIWSDHDRIELEIKWRKIYGKFSNNFKLNTYFYILHVFKKILREKQNILN